MSDTVKLSSKLIAALPFWISLLLAASVILGVALGGFWLFLPIVFGWYITSIMDALLGTNELNADPETPNSELYWYRMITIIWAPLQFMMVFGLIYYATHTPSLKIWEMILMFIGVGVASGSIGINYAHELMHQKPKFERWAADILMNMTLYGHFRSEHLLVHHSYVGTPRDPVTARFNEGFHRFFPRVLIQCFCSAWRAEVAMLARKSRPARDFSNPFWRYGALQLGFILLAIALGGWAGLGLFALQAAIAILQLELVNYVEHYGLTRAHLGNGKYEHVKPQHSWNSAHRVTNYVLINLQRHSDHHYKPDRRFPLLQTYSPEVAPQLPFGYPIMTLAATVPPLWKRIMNQRVRAWRKQFYPEISDWRPYNKGLNPLPK